MTNDDLWHGFNLHPSNPKDIEHAMAIVAGELEAAEPWEWRRAARWSASVARAIKKHAATLE